MKDNSHDLEILDKRIEIWRKRAADASRAQRLDPDAKDPNSGLSNKDTAKQYEKNIQELNQHRNAIKNGKDYTPTTEITAISKEDVGKKLEYSKTARMKVKIINPETGNEEEEERSINDFEDFIIPEAHHAIEKENRKRKWNYAETIQGNKFTRIIGLRGGKANREAAHKIRMEEKLDSGKK